MLTVEVGSTVVRILGGTVKMPLKVTEVTEERIICGDWEFCRITGGEIDEFLGWDGRNTGSFLILPNK
jgi:hypothetical protein